MYDSMCTSLPSSETLKIDGIQAYVSSNPLIETSVENKEGRASIFEALSSTLSPSTNGSCGNEIQMIHETKTYIAKDE